jgi:CheY-like chemotaxis protein
VTKRILWIDDDEQLIDDWATVFSEYGFDVAKATNTSRALTLLRTQRVDGVLLDVRLGRDENGLEFLDELRHRYATLPVAILTGNPDYGDWKDARTKGASGYLWKFDKAIPLDPVKQRQFFAALDEAFPGAVSASEPTSVANLPEPRSTAVDVFVSYAHGDERLRRGLETHLSVLRRQGVIRTWHDRRILPGTEWAGQIDRNLESADLILLLISPEFLASDYCYEIEMKRALERHDAGNARVIPIILRPVDWQSAPFGRLQVLPMGGKPIVEWRPRDRAFEDVARGIRATVNTLPP